MNNKTISNMIYILCLVGGLVLSLPAQAARSLDCSKAQSNVEHLVCDNPALYTLDSVLNGLYPQALSQSEDKQKTIKEQKQWLTEVRNVCQDVDCLKNAYQARVDVLQQSTTLCDPKEIIVYSCSLPEKKIVSLCASKDASVNSGYMQFRLGQNRASLELEYPQKKAPPKAFFKYYPPKGNGIFAVSFWLNDDRYSLFEVRSRLVGYSGAGVILNRGKNLIRVSYSECTGNPVVFLSYEGYSPISVDNLGKSLGLPETADDFSYYDPDNPHLPGESEDWRLKKAN